MSNFFVRGSKIWEILNSWWILLTFAPFGFTSFIAFLYVGFKAKNQWWKVFGFVYLMVSIVLLNIPLPDVWLGFSFIALWIISIIHALKIRNVFILNLSNSQIKKEERKISRIKQEKNIIRKKTLESEGKGEKLKLEAERNVQEKDFYGSKSIKDVDKSSNKKENDKLNIGKFSFGNRKKELRNKIRNLIYSNPYSLKYLQKNMMKTGSINHALLNSFKEKLITEVRNNVEFNSYSDRDLDVFIEKELRNILRRNK